MNEQPVVFKPSRDYFKLFAVVCFLLLAGVAAWLGYVVYKMSDKQKALDSTVQGLVTERAAQEVTQDSDGWSTKVTSGKDGFAVVLPDGWGPIIKVTNGDVLVSAGMNQPELGKGKEVKVTETEGYGTDSPSLFSIMLVKKGEAAPVRGDASPIAVGKGEDAMNGTKYSYIYPKDDVVGIGTQRFQGDRDYEYVFPVGDKELHVSYSVYGSDPRNLVGTVDQIVQRITVKK